ncbi:hypothetical protein BHE74_00014035 [Ensete ventricosum]|nr:hypothetical protein BHE74_00014035 [Ensete ventricosum]
MRQFHKKKRTFNLPGFRSPNGRRCEVIEGGDGERVGSTSEPAFWSNHRAGFRNRISQGRVRDTTASFSLCSTESVGRVAAGAILPTCVAPRPRTQWLTYSPIG